MRRGEEERSLGQRIEKAQKFWGFFPCALFVK